jgi:hypothetical protein
MDLMEKTVIEEEIGWWEVKFITISPFADVILRIMHVGVALDLRIPEAMIAKDEYNMRREFKHGGKKF